MEEHTRFNPRLPYGLTALQYQVGQEIETYLCGDFSKPICPRTFYPAPGREDYEKRRAMIGLAGRNFLREQQEDPQNVEAGSKGQKSYQVDKVFRVSDRFLEVFYESKDWGGVGEEPANT